MADKDQHIDSQIIDAIIEKPIPFTLNGRFFYIHQPSLGVSLLCSQLLRELHINDRFLKINQSAEIFRLCEEQREIALRVISAHTFSRRSDAIREEHMLARMEELKDLETADIATLIVTIFQWDSRLDMFIKHFQLDREKRTREKIATVKKNKGNSLTFGGRSLYGSLIDTACERYGWELGYVLWGISLISLNMMLADSVQSVFLTKDEVKEAHISTDGIYLDARDPKNLQEIARLINGN